MSGPSDRTPSLRTRLTEGVITRLGLVRRAMTLGVRGAVVDADNRVFLVRHTYIAGWFLPGGGVERGETASAAARRELREETGIVAEEEPVLHGLFLNDRQFRGDHVACFVLRRFRREAFSAGIEIAEARFFPLAALPDGTSGGTRRRIDEVVNGAPVKQDW